MTYPHQRHWVLHVEGAGVAAVHFLPVPQLSASHYFFSSTRRHTPPGSHLQHLPREHQPARGTGHNVHRLKFRIRNINHYQRSKWVVKARPGVTSSSGYQLWCHHGRFRYFTHVSRYNYRCRYKHTHSLLVVRPGSHLCQSCGQHLPKFRVVWGRLVLGEVGVRTGWKRCYIFSLSVSQDARIGRYFLVKVTYVWRAALVTCSCVTTFQYSSRTGGQGEGEKQEERKEGRPWGERHCSFTSWGREYEHGGYHVHAPGSQGSQIIPSAPPEPAQDPPAGGGPKVAWPRPSAAGCSQGSGGTRSRS